MKRTMDRHHKCVLTAITLALFLSGSTRTMAAEQPGYPFAEHIDQHTINQYPIETVYYWGKQLFEAPYNHLDGVGLNMKGDPVDANTLRFSRIPRADLPGWLIDPFRLSGPTARNCRECHNSMSGNMLNTVFDFPRQGDISQFVERQVQNTAGAGAIQLLAEQRSMEMWAIRDNALEQARTTQVPVTVELRSSNDISFGEIIAYPDGTLDVSKVEGVTSQPNPFIGAAQFQTMAFFAKGEVGFLRVTSVNPPNGMQSPEQYPEFLDADGDGVIGEVSAGDITAMTVYLAAEPRPVTKLELHRNAGRKAYGGRRAHGSRKFRLRRDEIRSIKNGETVFNEVGCAGCHTPELRIKNSTFNEPSSTPGFSFPVFWTKNFNPADGTFEFTDPLPYGYDINNPISFDLKDLPSIPCDRSKTGGNPGRHAKNKKSIYHPDRIKRQRRQRTCWREYETTHDGGIVIRPYTDLKMYDMGPGLAEDVVGFGGLDGAMWKTKGLWGVGSTGPWLHDGRATTLTEAIRWHGGAGQSSNDMFFSRSEKDRHDLITFLKNLVIYDDTRNAIQPSGNGFLGG